MQRVSQRILFPIFIMGLMVSQAFLAAAQKKEFYEIKVYHLVNDSQITVVDQFLKTAYLPALHREGIADVGVFKQVGNDTMADKRIYVFIPSYSMKDILAIPEKLQKDQQYAIDGKEYLDASYKTPPYARIETIFLQAFDSFPMMQRPKLTAPDSERIYELRSYEGPTENIHANKMQMFNKGGEFDIFKRLNFNIVFCGEVLAGSHMPNLMYMPTFDNMASHDEHWKNFGSDPQWKALSAMPQYQDNVSHIDAVFLYPADYSDF